MSDPFPTEPSTKRRRVSSDETSGSSCSDNSYLRGSLGTHESLQTSNTETLTDDHILCYYGTEGDDSQMKYPIHVKFGDSATKIFRTGSSLRQPFFCCPPLNKGKLELNEKQVKIFECFSECVEQMFGGLKENELSKNIWEDENSTLTERFKRSTAVESRYGLEDIGLSELLSGFYPALVKGFYNSQSRHAMYSLCCICLKILNISTQYLRNVGGSSAFSEGSSRVAAFHPDVNDDLNVKEIEELLNVEEVNTSDCHVYVPDFVIMKWENFEDPNQIVLFGECKSSKDILVRLWHQTLGGLQKSNSAYGCGAHAFGIAFIYLVKIAGTQKDMIITEQKHFSFLKQNKESPTDLYYFDTKQFCNAVEMLIQVIQEGFSDCRSVYSRQSVV